MQVLTRADIAPLIGHADVIPLMRRVFEEFAHGRVQLPDRIALQGPGTNDTILVMPAAVPEAGGVGTKVISIYPSNATRNLPTISSQIVLLDAETGRVRAILDGAYITELRTSAVSALATDILARSGASSLGVFGAGVQAKNHIQAILAVRHVAEVRIYSRTAKLVSHLCGELRDLYPNVAFDPMESPNALAAAADIIVTATTSVDPVFSGSVLRPGTHIAAIGSFKPHVRELDDVTISRSSIFVDILEHAMKEAGDLISPIERGIIGPDRIKGDLGELVTGSCSGRTDDKEITLFKSVGAAMEDIIMAAAVCDRFEKKNSGSSEKGMEGA